MYRSLIIHATFYILFTWMLFRPTDAVTQRRYSKPLKINSFSKYCTKLNFLINLATGIADIVRTAFQHGLSRFSNVQTSYDSDVFRYTQASQRGYGGLFAGESCRLSSTMCSHDEQCCSGRCLCRRWLLMGEERCIRKCF
jgi:hypothetical protein